MHEHVLHDILHQLQRAAHDAGRPVPRLLAVSKTQDETAVANLALQGQTAFGENYVQEAVAKHAAMASTAAAGRALEWHLIGHLQSNKAADAAALFDWVQTVDRPKLAAALARHRAARPALAPLNILIQVNIDDEASKHGCAPAEVPALAAAIAAEASLRLRGVMVIPTPHADPELRRPAFRDAKALFDALAAQYGAAVDTLSMGMSDDYRVAIAEGATMVRIGTALFGARVRAAGV
ncbi:YggS family pyridoxal phosphate-dependent enzyme [Lysobacter sp. TAB13]|uniref:YggS family pyridoxal phosphate-dependent enzyme n=1 Tax=Lysobacter sp. TAB13 TaxID=3233065 RepID=UPI003F95F758